VIELVRGILRYVGVPLAADGNLSDLVQPRGAVLLAGQARRGVAALRVGVGDRRDRIAAVHPLTVHIR
jgi:hypothetical protein